MALVIKATTATTLFLMDTTQWVEAVEVLSDPGYEPEPMVVRVGEVMAVLMVWAISLAEVELQDKEITEVQKLVVPLQMQVQAEVVQVR